MTKKYKVETIFKEGHVVTYTYDSKSKAKEQVRNRSKSPSVKSVKLLK